MQSGGRASGKRPSGRVPSGIRLLRFRIIRNSGSQGVDRQRTNNDIVRCIVIQRLLPVTEILSYFSETDGPGRKQRLSGARQLLAVVEMLSKVRLMLPQVILNYIRSILSLRGGRKLETVEQFLGYNFKKNFHPRAAGGTVGRAAGGRRASGRASGGLSATG